jgi:hypothetical protein
VLLDLGRYDYAKIQRVSMNLLARLFGAQDDIFNNAIKAKV